jgi:PBP1b-binding outer membrane lipoprotein LpoB
MLAGSIASQVHTNGGTKRTSYFVQMKLINIETSEIQWTEKHQISKEFRRSSGDW